MLNHRPILTPEQHTKTGAPPALSIKKLGEQSDGHSFKAGFMVHLKASQPTPSNMPVKDHKHNTPGFLIRCDDDMIGRCLALALFLGNKTSDLTHAKIPDFGSGTSHLYYLSTPVGAFQYLAQNRPIFTNAGIQVCVHQYEHPVPR